MAALPKYRPLRRPPRHRRGAARTALPSAAFANLAHELRTPIQVLLGCIEMLRDGDAQASRGDIVERMNRNVLSLAETVENVTDFARDGAVRERSPEEDVNLVELFDEIAPMLEAANGDKRLALRIDLDQAPVLVRVRRHALHSTISNLASNAIKFTAEGSVSIRMAATRWRGADALRLVVEDTGPGIAPRSLRRAFEPMVQLSDSNTREHRGLGLGLAIVRRNVRALGGWIRVKSEPAHGSMVTVVIPCRLREEAT